MIQSLPSESSQTASNHLTTDNVKAYVKRGKNDAADAAVICEAMSRPNMRFVAVKSEDQQATLMTQRTRELLIKQRTMSVPSRPSSRPSLR
jgi:transposase